MYTCDMRGEGVTSLAPKTRFVDFDFDSFNSIQIFLCCSTSQLFTQMLPCTETSVCK